MKEMILKLKDQVPDFKIPSTAAEGPLRFKDLKGQKVVLYFYPKDNTPGCSLESQEFNALLPKFKKENAVVLGISRDSLKSHQKFIENFNLKFPLLSDEDEVVCKLFDVIHEKNMYGKKVLGVVRSTFVMDEKGRLVGEFRKVKAPGHAREVLDFVQSLAGG
jgi:peroxiredoxin Q/BCP